MRRLYCRRPRGGGVCRLPATADCLVAGYRARDADMPAATLWLSQNMLSDIIGLAFISCAGLLILTMIMILANLAINEK